MSKLKVPYIHEIPSLLACFGAGLLLVPKDGRVTSAIYQFFRVGIEHWAFLFILVSLLGFFGLAKADYRIWKTHCILAATLFSLVALSLLEKRTYTGIFVYAFLAFHSFRAGFYLPLPPPSVAYRAIAHSRSKSK